MEPPLVGSHQNTMVKPNPESTDINISDKAIFLNHNLLPSPRVVSTVCPSTKNGASATSYSPQQHASSYAGCIVENYSSMKDMSARERRLKFFSLIYFNPQR